ncbi:MAG: hypothetical protein A2Z47_05070 [Thermodesulfovibrio sp. RBG_19FT_COMBO_42_12]|nr:MAG: hypothetical protein A2Z47_05070 [Thermodesulfovibrio sp. RBG_19FT_COMBO_42_12]
MHYEKIQVISYSGCKGDELPRAFVLHGEVIDVVEILNMWIEESLIDKQRKRFFEFKGSDGYEHKIFCDVRTCEWFLVKRQR